MNNKIKPLIFILVVISFLLVSCKKTDSPLTYFKQSGYNYIDQLLVSGDNLWVLSSNPNNNISTFLPVTPDYQLSVINMLNDQILINKEIPAITRFDLDNNMTPYLATYDKRVLKVNKNLSYDQLLEIPKISYIQKMQFDNENRLWIATNSGGLFFYNGIDTARFNTSNSILNSNSIQWMTMDSEFNIWFIQGTGLFKIDSNLTISKDPNLLPINNPTSAIFISADKNNALWVSKADTYGERLFKKDTNGPWTEITPPTSASKRPLKFIKADNNGTIWIAYSDYPKDILAYYDTNKWMEIKIPLDKVIILDAVTYKNQLILGTSEGIYPMVLE
jgi:hypothetical protein